MSISRSLPHDPPPSHLLGLLGRLSRRQRSLVKLGIDVCISVLALFLAFALRLGSLSPPLYSGFLWLLPMILCMRLPTFAWLGLYRSNLVQPGADMAQRVLVGIAISLAGVGIPLLLFQPPSFPRAVIVIEAAISAVLGISSREVMTAMLASRLQRSRRREPVLIYGAGNAGLQLAGSLVRDENHEFRPVCFVDDDPIKQGIRIAGLEVYGPSELASIRERYQVKRALFAIPSLPGWKRRPIIESLEAAGLAVSSVPSLIDLISGRVDLVELGEVSADDLLDREAVPPSVELLGANVTGKCVVVTGAGGSIGSELCRQIAALKPHRLVLFENSEFGLYEIEMELAVRFPDLQVVAILGTVLQRDRMVEVFQHFGVETIYHAAAYKHVPLVEQNPLQGMWNNVVGTWRTAEAAMESGVETFVLVSTDKAVRPSSVMGASKRASELACLLVGARALEKAQCEGEAPPRYVMVRFGNVLDSAGSVVPLFRKQICRGGPVTVTHPEVTRYFMTIPEASQLVLQAGALGRGGEVFLLEMGKPVKIADLAQRMIDLTLAATGKKIEICFTSLRPGEKLYEELLTDPWLSEPTGHPKIFQAREKAPPLRTIGELLEELQVALRAQDAARSHELLCQLVPDYKPAVPLQDIAQSGLAAQSFHGNGKNPVPAAAPSLEWPVDAPAVVSRDA